MHSQTGPDRGYTGLQKRLARKMAAAEVPAQMSEALEKAFEAALAGEPVVVSRAERKRLFRQISRGILEEMLDALDDK